MKISGIDFDFLTPYILDDTTEEINVNAWNDIEIVRGGRYCKIKEHFASPQAAADMAERLAQLPNCDRIGGQMADSAAFVNGTLAEAMRIIISNEAGEETGAVFTIRKQRRHTITREELLRTGTATMDAAKTPHVMDETYTMLETKDSESKALLFKNIKQRPRQN